MKKLLLILLYIPVSVFAKVEYNLSTAIEGYINTNDSNNRWSYDYFERKPLLEFQVFGDIGDYFYFFCELPLTKDRFLADNRFDAKKNYTNVIYDAGDIDFHIPKKSYIRIGSQNMNLTIGRDRFKLGQGMIINDEVFYYDFVKTRGTIKKLEYDFNLLSLDEFDNDKFFITHGLKYSWEKINISITEGILLEGLGFNISYLNPFTIVHNEFLAYEDNANAIMSLNMEFYPIGGLLFAGELAIDQYATPYEEGRWDKVEPNAMAFSVKSRYERRILDRSVIFDLSFTRSDPYYGIDSSGPAFTTTKKYVTRSQGSGIDLAEGLEVTDFVGFSPDKELLSLDIDILGDGLIDYGLNYSFERKGEVNSSLEHYEEGDSRVIHGTTPTGDATLVHTITGSLTFNILEGLTAYVAGSQLFINEEADTQFVISIEYEI